MLMFTQKCLFLNLQKERREKLWDPPHQVCTAEATHRLDQWDAEHPNPSVVIKVLILKFVCHAN